MRPAGVSGKICRNIKDGERMRAESFESLIRYEALISDNVVLMKDGCLLSGFRYIGADLDAVPAEEKQSVAAVASNALKHLGGGYMLHFETVRVRTTAYPKGEFSELVTKIIDTERELQFKNFGSHYETENYIFLTWEPPVMEKSTLLRKAAAFFTELAQNGTSPSMLGSSPSRTTSATS